MLVMTSFAMALVLVQAIRRREWRRPSYLWLTAATLTNLTLIAFLAHWRVMMPG
jgi:hypothetical protein